MGEEKAVSDFWSPIKDANAGYVCLAAAVALLALAIYLFRYRQLAVSDILPLSLDAWRGYATALAGVLVSCIVVAWMIGFFWTATSRSEFTSIAPFTISGSDDKQRGVALATAFHAKLAELVRDTSARDPDRKDKEKARKADSGAAAQAPDQDMSESDSMDVYENLNLDLNFHGVDVGGILSGIVNWMALRRALQISVAEQDGNAIVSGALSPDGRSHVYASVKSNEEIVAAVAYSKFRERLVARQPEFEALDWTEIKSLHDSIVAIGRLRTRSQATREDYKSYDDTMAKLIAKAPRLEPLLRLGAEVAMKAGNVRAALAYLDRSREFLSKAREELDQKRLAAGGPPAAEEEDNPEVRELKRKFLKKYNSLIVLRQRVIASRALPFVECLNQGNPVKPIFEAAFAEHGKLLNIGLFEPKREITVAIVGGIPQREQSDYKIKAIGDSLPGKYGLDDFADTIGLIMTALAPTAKLVFVPLGPKSHAGGLSLRADEAEIRQAVDGAVKAAADIVVIPFNASAADWQTRIKTVKTFASRTMLVLPAPSNAVQDKYIHKDIPEGLASIHAAFVASVDVDGKFRDDFLSFDETVVSYPGAIGAPGMRIPRLTADGAWRTTYGSAYAAATAAAAIANVAAGSGIKEPKRLIDLIRRTLHRPDDAAIGIIDQTSALTLSDGDPAQNTSAN